MFTGAVGAALPTVAHNDSAAVRRCTTAHLTDPLARRPHRTRGRGGGQRRRVGRLTARPRRTGTGAGRRTARAPVAGDPDTGHRVLIGVPEGAEHDVPQRRNPTEVGVVELTIDGVPARHTESEQRYQCDELAWDVFAEVDAIALEDVHVRNVVMHRVEPPQPLDAMVRAVRPVADEAPHRERQHDLCRCRQPGRPHVGATRARYRQRDHRDRCNREARRDRSAQRADEHIMAHAATGSPTVKPHHVAVNDPISNTGHTA